MGPKSIIVQRTLSDIRDGNSYTIRKLADGNCWMVQNLALSFSDSDVLTSSDTDLTTKSSWAPGITSQTSGGVSWAGDDSTVPHAFDSGDSYMIDGTTYSTTAGPNGEIERIGSFYNHYVAYAGVIPSSGLATDTICPKNWTIPALNTNSTRGSYLALLRDKYGLVSGNWSEAGSGDVLESAKQALKFPLNFILAGLYHYNGWPSYTYGQWFAAEYSGWTLVLLEDRLIYGRGPSNDYGFSIRCVAR